MRRSINPHTWNRSEIFVRALPGIGQSEPHCKECRDRSIGTCSGGPGGKWVKEKREGLWAGKHKRERLHSKPLQHNIGHLSNTGERGQKSNIPPEELRREKGVGKVYFYPAKYRRQKNLRVKHSGGFWTRRRGQGVVNWGGGVLIQKARNWGGSLFLGC